MRRGNPVAKRPYVTRMAKSFLFACVMLFSIDISYVFAKDSIDEYISKMTVHEKIGQIMMIGLRGNSITNSDIQHIREINPGGIVLYARNLKESTSIARISEEIMGISLYKELPLFLAIDQEGGIVHRIEDTPYRPPAAPAIGAAGSEKLAFDVGLSVGSALRKLGINMNFAPVLDVASYIESSPMTQRSFGDNAELVATLGTAYIKGLKKGGVLSTGKHFPGIGRTSEDSHQVLPRITWNTANEKEEDLKPFRDAINAGVDCIMVGHVIGVPGDDMNPVSLSSYWMTELLRKEMDFEGLIMVDNIEMQAIETVISFPDAAVKAFLGGADIIMVSHEPDTQRRVFEALLNAFQENVINRERLDKSIRRIFKAKAKIMSLRKIDSPLYDIESVSRSIAENSVIMFRKQDSPQPALSEESRILYTGYDPLFYKALKRYFNRSDIMNAELRNFNKLYKEISLKAFVNRYELVIIDSEYPDAFDIQFECKRAGVQTVFLIVRPWKLYEIVRKFNPEKMIVLFDKSNAQYQTIVDILSNKRKLKGIWPYVKPVPKFYMYGT